MSVPELTPDELRTLELLLGKLSGRGAELPWPLFRFITEVAATVNVDLLVRDEARGVLLAWRDDPFGAGWHVPGSIIRHREEIAHRIAETARTELGCAAEVSPGPVALVQIFDDRGHSVSMVYLAELLGVPGKRVVLPGEAPQVGDLRWFAAMPDDTYPSHRVYRDIVRAVGMQQGIRVFTQHTGRRDNEQNTPAGTIGVAPLV